MTEKDVVAKIKSWLIQCGWTVLWANHKKRNGVDIAAEKNGQRWYIETKGDAKHDDIANQDAAFYSAIGQVVAYRVDGNAKYSIAFPSKKRYEDRWRKLPCAARCAMDTCLFVTASADPTEES